MKKSIAILLVLVMMLSMLAGCGGTDTPDVTESPSGEVELAKNQVINVYSWWDPTNSGLTALKEGFEAEYAEYNATINFVKVSSYYQTMITKLAGAQLAGGSAEQIDVMMLAYDQLPLFAQNGQLKSLDGLIEQSHIDAMYDSVKSGLYYNDTLYAVPRDVTTWCAYINVDMFEQYGIDIPSDTWTLDDFYGICEEFAAKGTHGFATNDYSDVMSPWVYLFGGQYFDAEKGLSTLTSDGSSEGLKTLYGMMERNEAMTIAEAKENGKAQDAFARDEVAIFFGGISDAVTLEGYDKEFVVVPLPAGVNGQQSHTFTTCWTVPEVTTNEAWSVEVVKYLSSEEGQKIATENNMGMPAVEGVDVSDWISEAPYRQYFIDALGYESTSPYQTHLNGSAWGTNVRSLLRDDLFNVRGLSDAQIDALLEEIDAQLTYFLKGGV